MQEADIYSSILDYMCENYDYTLYATDFNAKRVSSLQRAIASVQTTVGTSRAEAIKTALQDFFNAIFQKVFVYEDEERFKIVKYFDKGADSEEQDRQIHALRQELIYYKDEVENTFFNDSLYMFDKPSRNRFEATLLGLKASPLKEIIREQITMVYDLEPRDIVIFLNKKIFLKKFNYIYEDEKELDKTDMLHDERFVDSLGEELSFALQKSIDDGFDFFRYSSKEFYEKYPQKFFSIINKVVKSSIVNIDEKDLNTYNNVVFKQHALKMLKDLSCYLFNEVLDGNLRAIKFLKQYSESKKIYNSKMKLHKAPLMNKKGKIYNFQSILATLKRRELLSIKITHKNIEIKNIELRVHKAQNILERSLDEMEKIKRRRSELLFAIEQVEDEIFALDENSSSNSTPINRLEFSKRDLLEAFKQVEITIKTQTNILNNTRKELKKWEEKREEKRFLKEKLFEEQMEVEQEYNQVCEILATSLSKEPIEF